MSKGPTQRHSKSPAPVTIDLDATDVTPKNEDLKATPAEAGPATSAPASGKPGSAAASATPAQAKSADTTGSAKDAPPASGSAAAKTEAPAAGTAATGTSDAGKSDAAKAEPGKAATDTKSASAAVSAGASASEPKSSVPSAGAKSPSSQTGAATGGAGQSGASAAQRSTSASGSSGSSSTSTSSGQPTSGSSGRGGGFGLVLSGVIGAVIALGGNYLIEQKRADAAPAASAEQVEALATRLDSVAGNVDTLSSQVGSTGGNDAVAAELAARLDSLEASLKTVTAGAPADPEAMAALNERFAALEGAIAKLGDTAGGTGDPEAAAQIQSALADLEAGTTSKLADLTARIDALEQRQSTLSSQVAAPAQQVDLAQTIAAAGLKSAIDRGGSFMTELEAFASVAPDDPAVAELRQLAASGVPSRSQLIEDFDAAANKAIAAAEPADPDQGLVDRLVSSALSSVKVRQVGNVEGDGVQAILARTETRLVDGDIEAALAEWNTLPDASRTAASAFGEALTARARAEKLVASTMAPAAPAPSEAPVN